MNKLFAATLLTLAVAAPVSSAFARTDQFEDQGTQTIVVRGHRMQVHAMGMQDGTTVYGLTRPQLQMLNAKWLKEVKSTDGSGR
jgi:hypothetical protein